MNVNFRRLLARFCGERSAVIGAAGILLLLGLAVYAPFLASGRPLLYLGAWGPSSPFGRAFFAPDSTEVLMEKAFNFAALFLPAWGVVALIFRRRPKARRTFSLLAAVLLALPFFLVAPRMDKTVYRGLPGTHVFAPIPYGPDEIAAAPLEGPSRNHLCGTDAVGRDLAARLLYGSRVSLAVGICSTALALFIGAFTGMLAGFFRGWFDLLTMRIVEIFLCFPTFLLLLIVMAMLGDRHFEQSVPVLIAVLTLTGWIGAAFLARGETLKQCSLSYVDSCLVSGIPTWRILWRHLLPNVAGPLLICFTFGVAGAILAESGLSFLGFGVRQPTASWGGLLRQAFDDPLANWHLTFFPGAALFLATVSFNFTGEGLRRCLPRS